MSDWPSKLGSASGFGPGRAGAEPPSAADEPDEMPLSRVGRMAELGRLGAKLSVLAAQTGAMGLLQGEEARARLRARAHADAAASLVETLGKMRGVAAKFGQFLVQRPGSLPDEYVESLFELSDRVPPMGYTLVKTQVLSALGRSPTQIFAKFERQPLASASFGQVHRAELADGVPLAVKVQYPAVAQSLRSDLDNLRLFAGSIAKVVKIRNVEDILLELEEHLTGELDYRREAASQETFRGIFEGHDTILVPAVHPELTTTRVLTSQLIGGVDLRRYVALQPAEAERQRYASALLLFGWTSIFRRGILHADPNPGNYLFDAAGKLGVVDFGCVKRFNRDFVVNLQKLMLATIRGDRAALEEALIASRLVSPGFSALDMETASQTAETWGRPFVQDSFDFTDRKYLEDLLRLQDLSKQATRKEAMPIPRDWLFYGRHIVGTTYLLHRLGARGHFRAAIERFVSEPVPEPL